MPGHIQPIPYSQITNHFVLCAIWQVATTVPVGLVFFKTRRKRKKKKNLEKYTGIKNRHNTQACTGMINRHRRK